MKKLFLILLIAINVNSAVFNQTSGNSNNFSNDFEYLIEKLIETHPDPYSSFGDQIEFYRKKKDIELLLSDTLTSDEFIIATNQFLSCLNDGHTYLFLPNSNDLKKFPLQLKIAANVIFVDNTITEYKNLIGCTIIAINDISIEKCLRKASSFLPSENISGNYYNLVKIITDFQLAQKFFNCSDEIKISFKDTSKNQFSLIIAYRDSVNIPKRKSEIRFDNDNNLLFYSMIGKNKDIAYLKWNSIVCREVVESTYKNSPDWVQGNLNWAYSYLNEKQTGNIEMDILKIPALYEQFYKLSIKIKKNNSKYLVLDLRENNGGMTSVINPLLYKLYGEKYLNFDFEAEMIRKISPLYLKKIGYNTIDKFNRAYKSNYKMGEYIFGGFGNVYPNLPLKQKREILNNGYNGCGAEYLQQTKPLTDIKIFVICSPKTFSAAYHFTYFLKKLGRTKIVGVASRQAGNAFMETTSLTLPETKINGSISNSKQVLFGDTIPAARILKPDYEMTWEDYKKYEFDENSEILRVIDIIENKN